MSCSPTCASPDVRLGIAARIGRELWLAELAAHRAVAFRDRRQNRSGACSSVAMLRFEAGPPE
jgi:hypothetical protein